MVSLQDFKEDLPLLVESGLIAVKQGDEESAKKLFNAIGIIDPQNLAKKMGYGLIALHKMDIENAQKHFQEILQVEQTNWRAQSFLALAYLLSVFDEEKPDVQVKSLQKATELAQEVVKKSDASTTKELALSLLEWEKQLQDSVEERGPAG